MDVKEKLVELLRSAYGTSFNAPYLSEHELEPLASHLIANGVTVQERNDPITMDELRKMDGEPVWVSVSKNWRESGVSEGWCIVRFHSDDDKVRVYIYDTRHGARFFAQQDYGISWLAYRQPPKGETNNA